MDLSPQQLSILERLVAARIGPIVLPTYSNAVCVSRDGFVAALVPTPDGRLTLLGEPGFLIDGKLAVAIEREGKRYFVFKQKSVPVTEDIAARLASFRSDLLSALA